MGHRDIVAGNTCHSISPWSTQTFCWGTVVEARDCAGVVAEYNDRASP
jgi:hypothetical protein